MKEQYTKIINQAVQLIMEEAKDEIGAILLFGSHADNTAIWRSDIDICVVFKNDLTEKEAFFFRRKLLGQLPDVVDLQVFNVLPQKIKQSIAKNHQVLFQVEEFNDATFTRVNLKLFFELKQKVDALEA
ncbi:nucleotidyltransferase domain-containing protein [Candidatus Woesearchaeota archaeon]|nr:nucleotidyltransferase domain-containing protein [Candidatus Woesearchaeota archaeon]